MKFIKQYTGKLDVGREVDFSKSRFEGRCGWGIDNTRGERVPRFNNSVGKEVASGICLD